MGSGSFDADAYASFSKSVADKPRDAVYSNRGMHSSLDPKGVTVRESRDSADNPNSTPIIVALDVTGSMGMIAEQIAKEGLGTLFDGILTRKPVTDPHLMFMGIGDANCDRAPLQVSQFEADNRIVGQLTNLWLESGGGGNSFESYDLAWYFAARHTQHDAMAKRGKRGLLFTVGDEEVPPGLTSEQIERVLGYKAQADVTSARSLADAQRLYDVYHVVIEEGHHARFNMDKVRSSWSSTLGQRVIYLPDHKLLAETIVATIQVANGADVATAAAGWGGAVKADVIGKAVSTLPRGTAPTRQLGSGA